MNNVADERPDIPTKPAADYIHSTPNTLKTWRSRGKGPPYYSGLGKEILYRQSDLDRFIESRRVDPSMRKCVLLQPGNAVRRRKRRPRAPSSRRVRSG